VFVFLIQLTVCLMMMNTKISMEKFIYNKEKIRKRTNHIRENHLVKSQVEMANELGCSQATICMELKRLKLATKRFGVLKTY